MKWSTIQTHSVNIARMSSTFVDTSTKTNIEALDRLIKTVGILPRCLMNRLLGNSDDEAFKKEVLATFTESDFTETLLSSTFRTTTALIELSFALDELPIDEKRRLEIDKSIDKEKGEKRQK